VDDSDAARRAVEWVAQTTQAGCVAHLASMPVTLVK
jgi:hypothetical protein